MSRDVLCASGGEMNKDGVAVGPLQVAAMLLEHAIDEIDDDAAAEMVKKAAS